jgi:hypothetical protein
MSSINVKSDNTLDGDDTAIREDVINGYNDGDYNVVFDAKTADTNPCEE